MCQLPDTGKVSVRDPQVLLLCCGLCCINQELIIMWDAAQEGVNADVSFEPFTKITRAWIDPVKPILFGYRVTGVEINWFSVRRPYLLSIMPPNNASDLMVPCSGNSRCLGISRWDAPNLVLSQHVNDLPLFIPERRLNERHVRSRRNLTRLFATRPNETLAVRDVRNGLAIWWPRCRERRYTRRKVTNSLSLTFRQWDY